ncbi:GIY-YIG nuclease family protein, partial [Algoriphagus aestuarii]|nr:GIY-YIG nuclease family protein [Algoriphagus aestuarii]
CYILFSPSLNKFYTGITLESVDSRIEKHNLHQYGAHRFTAKASDWELYLQLEAQSYSHARRMELRVKKMKSAKFIRDLKENLDMQ